MATSNSKKKWSDRSPRDRRLLAMWIGEMMVEGFIHAGWMKRVDRRRKSGGRVTTTPAGLKRFDAEVGRQQRNKLGPWNPKRRQWLLNSMDEAAFGRIFGLTGKAGA